MNLQVLLLFNLLQAYSHLLHSTACGLVVCHCYYVFRFSLLLWSCHRDSARRHLAEAAGAYSWAMSGGCETTWETLVASSDGLQL